MKDMSEPQRKFKKFKPDTATKTAKNELYKPPTVEELNQLRETEILFNSNIFRLQTDELVKEVFVKQKRKREIEAWIKKLQTSMETLPEYTENKFADFGLCANETEKNELTKDLKEIARNIPVALKTDQNARVKLLRPFSVDVIGLYRVNAITGPKINVTLNIVMPKLCFNDKDYLNSRYLVKRNLYLSYIACNLKTLSSQINYQYLNGNQLIPVLQIIPKDAKNSIVKIIVTPEENTFKLSRFSCDKSNLRSTYFNSCAFGDLSSTEDTSTPFYNASILHDLTLNANDSYCREALTGLKGACDGLILLTIWLKQRELMSDGFGGFTEQLIYSLVAYLIKSGRINKHMSSYQVIRNIWNHFVQSEWNVKGPNICEKSIDIEEFHRHYNVVFIDATGSHNLAAHLDINIYHRIKFEANLALKYLDEGKLSSFQSLFLVKMPFYMQYDTIINITNCSGIDGLYSEIDDKYKLDYLYFKTPLIVNKIIDALNYGLGDRIIDIVPKISENICWDIGTKPNTSPDTFVTLGLHFNSSNMFKVVNKGPQAYDTLAEKFRQFWGTLSELRRFKDGSITEAVYWSATNVQEKRNISKKIIEFVLKDKLNLTGNLIYNEFDPILQIYTEDCVEEANLKVINLFDELSKKLRELNLPLSISAIQGISQSFCHSDPFPPKNMNYKSGDIVTTESDNNILFKRGIDLKVCPKYVAPIEGIIQMVHHSKWPNNVDAMKYLRSAFYLQISEQLCRIVEEDDTHIRTNVNHDYLEILYRGFIFRFTLFHPKQIQLLKTHKDDRGFVSFRDTPESVQLEKQNVILPKIMGALNGVHSQHPSYGPATILMKRWLNAQLLDEFFMDPIIVSLLSASLYLDSAPFQPPNLPQIAFFRFLLLLVNHPFSAQPLIVNFNDEITKQQRDEFETKFQQHRNEYPSMCIITPFDLKSTLTEQNPTIEVLHRVIILAKECLDVIEKNIQSQSLSDTINGLFTPNLSGYNVIIHIQQLLNPRRNESITRTFTSRTNEDEYEEKNKDKMPIVQFNPVELYLRDLRQNYSNYALFFHDSYGGDVIAVLWKPIVFQKQQFKISNIDGMKLIPDEDKLQLQVNVDALIEDFVVLGNGIIKNIDVL